MTWLNYERLRVYPRLFFGLYVTIYIYLILPGILGPNLLDRYGTPVGADFSGFYSGAVLARSQGPAAVYDLAKMRAAHEQTIGAKTDSIAGWWWVYPPTCLLLVLPFSFLPYFVALAIWLISTFSIYFGDYTPDCSCPANYLADPGLSGGLSKRSPRAERLSFRLFFGRWAVPGGPLPLFGGARSSAS